MGLKNFNVGFMLVTNGVPYVHVNSTFLGHDSLPLV